MPRLAASQFVVGTLVVVGAVITLLSICGARSMIAIAPLTLVGLALGILTALGAPGRTSRNRRGTWAARQRLGGRDKLEHHRQTGGAGAGGLGDPGPQPAIDGPLPPR